MTMRLKLESKMIDSDKPPSYMVEKLRTRRASPCQRRKGRR